MYNKKSGLKSWPKVSHYPSALGGSFPAGFLAVAGGRLGNLWHTIHDALCHFLQSGEVHTWDVAMYYHAMREFWEGQNGSQAKYETKRRLEWNQGLQKRHQGRRMAATFCNGANFRDSKVVKQTPWDGFKCSIVTNDPFLGESEQREWRCWLMTVQRCNCCLHHLERVKLENSLCIHDWFRCILQESPTAQPKEAYCLRSTDRVLQLWCCIFIL